jgi:hypothetical protein
MVLYYVSTKTTLYIFVETYRDMLDVASSSKNQRLRQPDTTSMQNPRAALWDRSVCGCKCRPSSLHPGTPVCRHDWWLVSQCTVWSVFFQWHKFNMWASVCSATDFKWYPVKHWPKILPLFFL